MSVALSLKDVLSSHQYHTPGRAVSDSNRYPGHENRMAGHIHRVRTHACEQPAGRECRDCIRRKGR
jgi:hypothetical protein